MHREWKVCTTHHHSCFEAQIPREKTRKTKHYLQDKHRPSQERYECCVVVSPLRLSGPFLPKTHRGRRRETPRCASLVEDVENEEEKDAKCFVRGRKRVIVEKKRHSHVSWYAVALLARRSANPSTRLRSLDDAHVLVHQFREVADELWSQAPVLQAADVLHKVWMKLNDRRIAWHA